MYLQKDDLKELSTNLIENNDPHNYNNISYDLRIDQIKWISEGECTGAERTLQPGDTVFVSTIEKINMPNDMIAYIIPRNSSIQSGLDIAAPVYQPGHRTKIFARVTNIADNELTLKKAMSVFSIMFYKLDKDCAEPYDGTYQDQTDFVIKNEVHSVQAVIAKSTKKSKETIESLTKNIYSTVLTLMGIFVTIFSLFNLNINSAQLLGIHGWKDVIICNLVLLGSISLLITMIRIFIFDKAKENQTVLYTISIIAFLVSIVLSKLC